MNTQPKKILFADDDQDFLFAVKEFYENSNWQFDFAENGVVALDLAMREKYDLISLDINMPFMKGNEAINNIRQIYPDQKIIAFTAITEPEKKIELIQAGFDEIISKPVSFQQMHNMFSRILENKKLDDEIELQQTEPTIDNNAVNSATESTPSINIDEEPLPDVSQPQSFNDINNDSAIKPAPATLNQEDNKMEFMKKYSFSILQNESKETLIMMIQGLAREIYDLKNK